MKLSIVSTLFQSESSIEAFVDELVTIAAPWSEDDFELILVDDGSPDNSLAKAKDLLKKMPQLVIVELSRNFGHHAAISAGLEASSGDYVFLIDSDLEEDPHWLVPMSEKLSTEGLDVVFAVQEKRTGGLLSRIGGAFFWRTLSLTGKIRIMPNQLTCRLMTREYVDALMSMQERVMFLAGLFSWAGFKQASVVVSKRPAALGRRSSYTPIRRFLLAADSLTSFNTGPIYVIFWLGLIIWAVSALYSVFLVLRRIFIPEIIVEGFTTTIVSIWFLGGTLLFGLGAIGIYVGNIFTEVKQRPRFIVRRVHRQ